MKVEDIRRDFPVLNQNDGVVYLDNGATTLKPQSVIQAVVDYYTQHTSNIHRGDFDYAHRSNKLYEQTRETVKNYIHAEFSEEVIFTFGTTHGFNLLSRAITSEFKPGDEIILTEMEHHANIVPWQMVAKEKSLVLRYIQVTQDGELDMEHYKSLLNNKTKIVSVTQVSNVLGTVNPVEEMAKLAHSVGALFVVDGAQAVGHIPVNVQKMNVDFFLFSSHKLYGPSGVGILYGKKHLLEKLPKVFGGGGAILTVDLEKTIFAGIPHGMEPGTPAIEGALGLGKAMEYVLKVGFDFIVKHEEELRDYATKRLAELSFIRIYGKSKSKIPIISFEFVDVHPHDVGTLLNDEKVAVRTGRHCTFPLLKKLDVAALTRASFSFYNTKQDVDRLVSALKKVKEVMNV